MCELLSLVLGTVASIGASIATKQVTNNMKKKAAGQQMLLQQEQEKLARQQNAVADRNAETVSTLRDNSSNNIKRDIASMRIPLLKTAGTGANLGDDVGLGLNLGGNG